MRFRRFASMLSAVAVLGCGAGSPWPATPDDAWKSVELLNGSIKVSFPSNPATEVGKRDTKQGTAEFTSYKVMSHGIFFNVLLVTFPESVIAGKSDKVAFLMQLSERHESAKEAAQRQYLRPVQSAPVPTVEHRFQYSQGTTKDGQTYAPGFALWRTYLIDNTVCSVFTDVVQSAYDSAPHQSERRIETFFSSVELRDAVVTEEATEKK